ncbi:hypothetical protein CHARACLAT_029593 [Characodon lateralis]|uniref:Uncharacterized protein n=1 Tax=Characodon lateralis TaxID=208331 RepID=A0ABU7ENV5_9TELE|nr:hypothetical protein [Characodon lateralis]
MQRWAQDTVALLTDSDKADKGSLHPSISQQLTDNSGTPARRKKQPHPQGTQCVNAKTVGLKVTQGKIRLLLSHSLLGVIVLDRSPPLMFTLIYMNYCKC